MVCQSPPPSQSDLRSAVSGCNAYGLRDDRLAMVNVFHWSKSKLFSDVLRGSHRGCSFVMMCPRATGLLSGAKKGIQYECHRKSSC